MGLIVSWHPTYVYYRNPYEWGAFEVDMQRFGRLVRGELRKPPKVVTDPALQDIGWLSRQPFVAVDIETKPENSSEPWTGKQPTRARLNLLGIGTEELAISFRWSERPDLHAAVKRMFANPKQVKVLQNGTWFDRPILLRHGIELRNVEDTRDARRSISSTSPLALDYMGSLYDDVHQWKAGKDWDNKEYNAMDCAVTARSWTGITREPEWKDDRTQGLYSLHKQLSQICAEMHQTGIQVDKRQRAWMAWALQEEYEEKASACVKAVGLPGFRCTPNDIRAIIYKRHEKGALKLFSLPDPIDPAMYTNEQMNSCSVDFDSLVQVLIDPSTPQKLREIIDLYWGAVEVQKARSTFITSKMVEQAIGPDGRLRPGWNSCGTDTGRFSCSEPNVMNIEQVMRAYLCARRGHVLVHGDFSQLELRVMAVVAQDTVLQGFLDTGDVYSSDARAFFGLPAEMDVKKVKPDARKAAKIIHLGSQYAAGTNAVYMQALRQDRTLKYPTIQLLHNQFKKTYYRTVQYWQEEMHRVHAAGYSESRILGRRRVYPRPPPITEVANYPIQSTASDIANLALIELHSKLKSHVPSARIIIQLHDAFDVECRTKDEADVRDIMQEVMETPRLIDGKKYQFPVEIKSATHWHEV